jgi:pilus assembly protein CpaE
MAIVAREADVEFARAVADKGDGVVPHIVIGSPASAIPEFTKRTSSPSYLLIDIGESGPDILSEIDAIAEYCEVGTRVIILGQINDVNFYRMLKDRGVSEYFTKPAKAADIKTALYSRPTSGNARGTVITFMSAASGDGASTVALNTAYALATEYNQSVVLVDMDYQFGMIAKNLDMTSQFGIKELFDNPDRGIDSTLIKRMILSYKNSQLKVIAAPNQLNYLPDVPDVLISHLVATLSSDYDFVIIDLPHMWTHLVSSALLQSNHIVMVTQLLLRSITHASRLLNTWRKMGIKNEQIALVANRSGAKFKEALTFNDFERVCSLKFRAHFGNDTKNVIAAENNGRTILEGGNSDLSQQFKKFAGLYSKTKTETAGGATKQGSSFLPKRLSNLMGNN